MVTRMELTSPMTRTALCSTDVCGIAWNVSRARSRRCSIQRSLSATILQLCRAAPMVLHRLEGLHDLLYLFMLFTMFRFICRVLVNKSSDAACTLFL